MVMMKYRTIMFNDRFFILLSQFVAILIKLSTSVSIRNSNLKSCTLTTTKDENKYPKKSDICHRAFNFCHFCILSKIVSPILFLEKNTWFLHFIRIRTAKVNTAQIPNNKVLCRVYLHTTSLWRYVPVKPCLLEKIVFLIF